MGRRKHWVQREIMGMVVVPFPLLVYPSLCSLLVFSIQYQ